MGKKLQFNILFNARESILFAATIWLLNMPHPTLDWFALLAVITFLIEALVIIIREESRLKWDKGILGFSVCWAILTTLGVVLSRNITGMEWLTRVMPVWENITLVLVFALMLLIFVLAITYSILHKCGKWTFDIPWEKAAIGCMGDYLTVAMLLLSCLKAF